MEAGTRRFLDSAARFYASKDCATSAFLAARRDEELASVKVKKSVKQSFCTPESCKGCGTVLIAGVHARIEIRRPKPKVKSRKRGSVVERLPKHVVITCLKCHRYTKTTVEPLPRKKAKQGQVMAMPQQNQNIPKQADLTKESTRENASSKQRAKARRQGGLQAMLEKLKPESQPANGHGLDLMDLMKHD